MSSSRATFGATQNRFEAVISSVQSYAENVTGKKGGFYDRDNQMQ